MRVAYFDCFAGISGDMCLGALVDAGVSLKELARGLKKLPVTGYSLSARKVIRAGLAATKVDVRLSASAARSSAAGTRWKDIEKTVAASALSKDLREKGLAVFRHLFEAEAKVHGKSFSSVHLHEAGGIDCMVDVFGALIGLKLLGIDTVYSSPVNAGAGTLSTAHGTLPVPAPATAELLRGVPIHSSGALHEATTPTGAALLKSLAAGFQPLPELTPDRIGIGAGSRDTKGLPNVLRIITGESPLTAAGDIVTIIETNIDDMNPQVYEYLSSLLFEAGARDVSLTPVMMKKMRPAVMLSVICGQEKRDDLIDLILRETTSIGVRYYEARRAMMSRVVRKVDTRYGRVRVKISSHARAGEKFTPEYEDCKAIALKKGVSLLRVMEEAKRAAAEKLSPA
ncbi:MAG: nickel pincer cofactor biosynthesis protein LarC [Nitrospiraceae bacterium]|nr:nickel pincer cofactor biosynthesis protein LarC [Nitrospiraceae bacterium]